MVHTLLKRIISFYRLNQKELDLILHLLVVGSSFWEYFKVLQCNLIYLSGVLPASVIGWLLSRWVFVAARTETSMSYCKFSKINFSAIL